MLTPETFLRRPAEIHSAHGIGRNGQNESFSRERGRTPAGSHRFLARNDPKNKEMKMLTLVRHAKSSWDDPSLEDRDRPLSPRGLRDAPHMAAHLAQLPNPPDALVSSPAARAMATAEIFASQLSRSPETIVPEPAIYEAHWKVLLEVVRSFREQWNHVCLFGHNPGFEELAGNLLGEPLAGLPTCSIVELHLGCELWKEAQTRRAVLSRLFFPKMFAWGCHE